MYNSILDGKRILFFSPSFFGYEKKICVAIKQMGGIVDFFDERSVNSNVDKALLKINPKIFHRKTEKYYSEILKKVEMNQYDYILFVKCDMPTSNVLLSIKEKYPKAKLCLYLWDSIDNIPNVKEKFQYFDYISTFDRKDSKEEGIGFRPLFYCEEYSKSKTNENYLYDLSFVGTIHSDRYRILKEIKKQAEEQGLKMYMYPYLQSKFIYYFYKLFKAEYRDTKIDDFVFDKISSQQIAEVMEQSKVVIDIQHPKQTGLTMRTIEMLGMQKKLLTTNLDIVNYDFYDEDNIICLDRKEIRVCKKQITANYIPLEETMYNYYSIYEWIICVLGEKKNEE